MLFGMLQGGFDPLIIIARLFCICFVVFCTMPIHEYAHALIATKLGDPTPRLSGRLTINPMAHISPLGALMILLCGFGYAKPVPVNPRNFKDPKKGMALTAIAGPIANLIMCFIFVFIATLFNFLYNKVGISSKSSLFIIYAFMIFFNFAAQINANLAVFNLLPIPPLDGSRILQLLIPSKYYYTVMQYERYIVIVVFVLILTGALSRPLAFLSSLVIKLFTFIAGLPFGI